MPIALLSASDRSDALRWDQLVSRSPFPDTYYRPGYVRAYELEGHGRAIALHVRSQGAEFLFPMLLRPISEDPAGPSSPQDAITPYGYGGMLPLAPSPPSEAHLKSTLEALAQHCKSSHIISVLLRLHPLLDQGCGLKPLAGPDLSLHLFGPTTAIPLGNWSEGSLRKGRRSDLALARRSLRVTWSSRAHASAGAPPLAQALGIFRALYEETMDRLQASAFYHFSPEYYAALAEGLGDGIAVALAWQQEQAVGGAIFFTDARCAHYHLSGTSEAGRALKATTLLIREGIEWARGRGCERLHLGGGAGGSDSLFDFKKGFGGEIFEYAFAGLVADRPRYERLVAARRATGRPLRPDFFPEYRA